MIIQIDRNNRKGVFMKADLIVRIRNNIQFGEPCTFDEALFWKCFGAIKGRVRTVSEHWKEDGYVDIKVDLNPQIHFTNNRGSSCQYRENQEERRRTPPICC